MRYEYDAVLQELTEKGGAYVAFPWDLKKETGKGRLKVHVQFFRGRCSVFMVY